jgi:hypothetical protein
MLLGLVVSLPIWVYYTIVVPGIVIALAKEYRDRVSKKGTPELKDALYTMAGDLAVYIPILWMLLYGSK